MIRRTLWALAVCLPLAAQTAPPKTHLKVGDAAPAFKLQASDGKTYNLADFKGKSAVVDIRLKPVSEQRLGRLRKLTQNGTHA